MIYLDNPATSWPKPPCMLEAMSEYMLKAGGNPGRSGHRMSTEAGRVVYEARERIAGLFGITNANRVAFSLNATMALNTAILSILQPGDAVLTTSCEHNSVMRPLRHLEGKGIRLIIAKASKDGALDLEDFEKKLKENPKLVVAAHASNVTGQIIPLEEIAGPVKESGAFFLLDAAQTAGAVDMSEMGNKVDIVAFAGHKGLLGPQGTGGLAICSDSAARELKPILYGGTGSRSAFEIHPDKLPDRLESGTQNGIGIAGLGASVQWLNENGIGILAKRTDSLTLGLAEGLRKIDGVVVYGPTKPCPGAHLICFNVKGTSPATMGQRLDERYGIMGRIGLHCSPASHKTIGTFPEGALRLGPGPFSTESEIEYTLNAVMETIEDGK